MNKRDAQQHLVAYKDNQREKEYALQHGALSNFKAKYLEKIPLGNGKFRYIYEEAKDKVSSTAKNAVNSIKTAVNPGAMTSNEKSVRTSSAQARTDVKKQQEAAARKAANEEINKRTVEKAQESSLKSRAIRDVLGDDYSESGNMISTGENSKIRKLINDRTKKASDEAKNNIDSAVRSGKIAETNKNNIMKKYHQIETHTYENKIEYGHRDPETHEFKLDYMESKKYPGDDGKLLTESERYKNQYMKEMLGVMNLSRYGDFEIKNGKVIAKNSDGSDASKEQLYFAKVLDKQLSEMYEKATKE